MNQQKTNRVLRIAANALLYVFILLCLLGVVFAIASRKNSDGAVTVFGRQMRVVMTSSMEKDEATDVSGYDIKDIPVNSLVFIKTVPKDEAEADEWYKALEVGDVLTFRYVFTRQETVTHRLVQKIEKPTGGYILVLRGDNLAEGATLSEQVIDTSLKNSPNYVIGKVTGQNRMLGGVLRALGTRAGIVCIVMLPAILIALFEIVRIVKIVTGDKRQERAEALAQQQRELEELRLKLKAYEQAGERGPPAEEVQTPQ